MMSLSSIAQALGGEVVSGGQINFPPPGHKSRRDRSASLRLDPSAPGGFLVNCRSPVDDPLVVKDWVRGLIGEPHRSGLNQKRALPSADLPASRQLGDLSKDDAHRTKLALRIWEEARTPIDSPVERYLARRGLDLPDDPREVIRFAPSCPFSGTRTRAMVALVRDAVTNAPTAVHRTALDLAGDKIEVNGSDRLAYGPIRGGAIKLTADELVTTCLGIGEGIESTLSLQLLPEFGRSPVWSLINASGIETFPVLSGIECLWIAVDNDPAGIAAADLTSRRWRRAGREVVLVKAVEASADLNDIVEARHV